MKLKKLDRKGQFYIFIALLLSSLIFTVYPSTLTSVQTEYSFQSITKNYVDESSKVVNSAIIKKRDIFQTFEEYTLDFIDYAATRNLNFELAYILINKTHIRIVNYLSAPIIIITEFEEEELEDHTSEIFNRDFSEFKLLFIGKEYFYKITKEDVQLKFLIRAIEK